MTQAMRFDVDATDRASAAFLKLADNVDKLHDRLKALDRMKAEPTVKLDTRQVDRDIRAFETRMRAAGRNLPAIRLDVQSAGALTQIDQISLKMRDLKALSPLKLRIEADDQATAQLAAVQAASDGLSAASPTVRVDVDSAGATAQLAAVLAQVRALAGSEHTMRVRLDSVTVLGQMAKIQTELNKIAGGTITIDADTRRLMTALAQARVDLAQLDAMEASPVVTADTELARHRIETLEAQLARIAGRQYTANVDVDVDKNGALGKLAKFATLLAGVGAAGGMAAAGVGVAVPAVASLAGSLVAASGAAGLLPGALLAGGAAMATLKVGLKGVSDALKETDPKAFAEALKELSPAAANFAKQVRSIGPAWESVQLATQNKLFAGLAVEMGKLSSAYLPSVRSGLGGVATQFNLLAKDMVGFATSSKTVGDVDTIFRNTTRTLEAARPAAVNLAAAFMDIGVVGTGMLPELATGFTNVTGRFREFIAEARESGQLQVWIQGGLDTLQQLGSVAGNVGSILGSVFTAAKASGADFLTTIERATAGVAEFMRSGQGQNALVDFFTASRAAIDAILPGLATLGVAAAQAVSAFSNTSGLQDFGRAVADIAAAIAPALPMLGELAGGTLSALSSGLSVAAAAVGPVVSALSGLVGALGPVGPAVLAMVVAFKGLSVVGGLVTTAGASLAAFAGRMGATEGATTRVAAAFSKAGSAIPILGVALVAIGAVMSATQSKADSLAAAVLSGSMSMQQAIAAEVAQLENRDFWFSTSADSANDATMQQARQVEAMANVTAEYQKQRAEMSPYQQLQADVAMAQNKLNDAIAEFGPNSQQAGAATAVYASAQDKLKAAQDGAKTATMSHTDAMKAQADAMSGQIGTALAYEDAVRRTGEAHKAAADALKASGANSNEYKAAVLDLSRAMLSQADAARAQGEAIGGAEAGAKAFSTEILRAADTSTQQGRDAFIKLASAMDTAGLSALSSTAQMSGLKTEIITLPDGRTVTVVVASERSKLDTTIADLNKVAATKYTGTITINGDPKPFQDQFFQSVTLANGTTAMLKLDADRNPISATIDGVVYQINATTGVMTIQGDPAPGKANLDGLKLTVDSTTGVMKIDGDPGGANAQTQIAVQNANGSTGTITIEGNPTAANGKTTAAVRLADGSKGTITIDGNQTPANGKIQATITYANGSTGRITVDANDAAARAAIANLQRPTYSTHTIRVTQTGEVLGSGNTGLAGGGLIGYAGGGMVGAARGLVLPGYAPGRDTVPAQVRGGGPRVMLSPGEAVLVPELVRQIGPRNILAANATASGGRPATVVGSLGMAGGGTTGAMPAAPQVFERILDAQSSRPGAVPGLDAARLTALSNAGVEKRLDALVQLLERRGAGASITVNDSSGDPAETARSTMLALRLS